MSPKAIGAMAILNLKTVWAGANIINFTNQHLMILAKYKAIFVILAKSM